MKLRDAQGTLDTMLAEAGLAEEALDPWATWKVFKAFARIPVDDAVDDVTVQYEMQRAADGRPLVALYLSREFSEPGSDGADPICHVGCELFFEPEALGTATGGEFWTQDFATFRQFVDAVESAAGFQSLVNAEPFMTSVYREEA
ncbi:MAG TPA: hypothetical protein VL328_12110 [Gemmatimonadaceae bacterium]|nr:hypothetical protein [Gemmatimonadaceae bacterium]